MTGTALEDLVTTLGALTLASRIEPGNRGLASMVISAVSDYSSGYDRTVAEWMDKPQDEIEQNGVYRELRNRGIPEHKARFIIGHTLGKKQAQINALVGALRAYATSLFAGMARTGTEGPITKEAQDKILNIFIDSGVDFAKNKYFKKNTNSAP